MINIPPNASLNAQYSEKTDFKRHHGAINVILLARHALKVKTIIAQNAHPDTYKMKILKLRILNNVSEIAQQENIEMVYCVNNVIEHAQVPNIMNVINVQMDLNKIQLFKLKVLKDVSKHVLQGLFLAMMEPALFVMWVRDNIMIQSVKSVKFVKLL